MHVLVTGANGFVGSALLPVVLSKHHKVTVVVRRKEDKSQAGTNSFVIGNIDATTKWSKALHGADVVIHLAARVHIIRETSRDPAADYRCVNTDGTLNLARQAAACGVRRFLFISTIGVNGNLTTRDKAFRSTDTPFPHDPYSISKHEAELGLLKIGVETGMEIVILRPPTVYGPRVGGNFNRLMRVIYRRVPLVIGLPKNKRSLIYVGNLVDAIIACLSHPSASGKTYLVSDSEAVSTADLIRKIGRALGRSSLLLRCPRIIFCFGAWLLGKSKEATRLMGSLEVDSSLIHKEVGWSPSTSLEEGLKITAEWFRLNKEQKLEIKDQKPRICFIMTSPFTYAAFIAPHVERLVKDFSVTVSFNDQESNIPIKIPVGARFMSMPIVRQIAPLKDLFVCWKYYKYLREQKFDAVLSLTPKGGIVAMLASWLARVPLRIHCFTGQVWATRKGIARYALKSIDRLLVSVASRILVDSESQRKFLVNSGVLSEAKGDVLGAGSICGVDTGRFRPDSEARKKIRTALGLSESDVCLLFVGRIKKEKGVLDLASAFQQLMPLHPNLHLLLVGPDEEGLIPGLRKLQNIHYVGYTEAANEYMAGSDILCLPSYREGFGSVLIEAGACGLPTVSSGIYGVTDAVVENETGLLHPPYDVETIAKKIEYLIEHPHFRFAMGGAGRNRVLDRFDQKHVCDLYANYLKGAVRSVRLANLHA